MSTLWKVNADEGGGRELYGEQYTDVWSVNSLHYSAASEASCDHVSSDREVGLRWEFRHDGSIFFYTCTLASLSS